MTSRRGGWCGNGTFVQVERKKERKKEKRENEDEIRKK